MHLNKLNKFQFSVTWEYKRALAHALSHSRWSKLTSCLTGTLHTVQYKTSSHGELRLDKVGEVQSVPKNRLLSQYFLWKEGFLNPEMYLRVLIRSRGHRALPIWLKFGMQFRSGVLTMKWMLKSFNAFYIGKYLSLSDVLGRWIEGACEPAITRFLDYPLNKSKTIKMHCRLLKNPFTIALV